MGFKDKLYKYMPVFLQNIGISLFGLTWKKRRFGGVFSSNLIEFKEREKYSFKQWEDYKLAHLKNILIHSFTQVTYYKKSFSEYGIDENFIKNMILNDLKLFPFLEKNNLRENGTTNLLSNILEEKGEYFSSSGSTGTPTKILMSYPMHQRWSAAFEARIRHWAGINNQSARGMIGGRRVVHSGNAKPPFYRYNIFEKQVYYSAYHISPQNAANYVSAMHKYKIEYMTGYAVSNYLLALYIKQNNLKAPKLKAVITSSEKLTPEMRTVFSEVYQCKTYDSWSGVEACALVTECEHGSLHISEDVGIIEIIDENGNEVKNGETGEVVCTGLLNFDQPLIRYRIGDRMTKAENQDCKCGRKMPIIKEIEGRLEDIVTGPDGRQMVRFHGLFINIEKIERAQVIQHKINEIEIKIQNKEILDESELNTIKTKLISQLGDINVIINQQQKIEQTSNGKYKAVISHLK